MNKIICALLSMALVLSSTTGSFTATGTQGTSATKAATTKSTATATVMPAPTEAQVKLLMDQYQKYLIEGNVKELEKIYTMTAEEKESLNAYSNFMTAFPPNGIKTAMMTTSAKLKTTVKKGSTYIYSYVSHSIYMKEAAYDFSESKGTVTVMWSGKSLKMSNLTLDSYATSTDPKKNALYNKGLQMAEGFGADYVEAMKQGIQPGKDYSKANSIDLTEVGQPIGLTLKNAEIGYKNIYVTPVKGEMTSIGIDLGKFKGVFKFLVINISLVGSELPIKLKAFADGKYVETLNITSKDIIEYRILDEQVVTFEIEAEEDFVISMLALYKEE